MNRIICIGNRLLDRDSLGPRVYDILSRRALPADVELIDGGLAGLDLLSSMDGCERVVFVDAILGSENAGIQILRADELQTDASYGHAGGLGYLLAAYQALGQGPETGLYVVGAGGLEAALSVAQAALVIAKGEEIPL